MEEVKERESRSERMKQAREVEVKEGKGEGLKKFPLGFYLLIAGGIWALAEFVSVILYFF